MIMKIFYSFARRELFWTFIALIICFCIYKIGIIMSKSIKSMQKRIDPDLLFGMISLSDRARFWRAIELHYE